jgi:hypothetical protein
MTFMLNFALALGVAVPVTLLCSTFYLFYVTDRELSKAELEIWDLKSQLRNLNVLLVFSGYDYYPEGGWRDAAGTYETLEKAKRSIELTACDHVTGRANPYDWCHVIDARDGETVWAGRLREGLSKDKFPAPGETWYEEDDGIEEDWA